MCVGCCCWPACRCCCGFTAAATAAAAADAAADSRRDQHAIVLHGQCRKAAMQIAKGLGLGLGGGCGCGAHSGCRRASGGCGRLRSCAASGRALLDLVVLLLLAASGALILILNTLSLVLLGLGLFTTTLNILSCIFLVVDFTNVVVVWLLYIWVLELLLLYRIGV